MKTHRPAVLFLVAASAAFSASAAAPSADAVSAAQAAAVGFESAVASADFASIYRALPSAWQKSLSDAAKSFATNVDPSLWSEVQSTVYQLSATAVKKSDLLAQTSAQNMPGSMITDAERRAFLVKAGAKLGAMSKAATKDALASGGLEKVLAAAPLSMKGVTDSVAEIAPSGTTAVPMPDGTVKVSGSRLLAALGMGNSVRMVEKDGKWVPAPLVEAFADSAGWTAGAAKAASIPAQQTAQIKGALGMIRGVAKQAASAQNAQQLQGMIGQALFPLMMLQGSLGAGGASGGSLPLPF